MQTLFIMHLGLSGESALEKAQSLVIMEALRDLTEGKILLEIEKTIIS